MMTIPRFIQIHTLHAYPAALLNRGEAGLAKRMPIGGAMRTRISSQCLKRRWREAQDEFSLRSIPGVPAALRSRNLVTRKVMEPVRAAHTASEDVVQAVEDAFNIGVYGSRGTTESSRQALLLGLPEVVHLQERAAAICAAHPADAKAAGKAAADLFNVRRGEGHNFGALLQKATLPAGLEGALFGRMITSDPGANIEAALHVAHAFTVHAEEREDDYFSVVDDLQRGNVDAGAAPIGATELTAGIFYGYVVADVPGLVSNLEGCQPEEWQGADRGLAGQVMKHLVHLIATVSPGAKLGSTAPYTCADLMLVEAGHRQPRSLANAYRTPAQPEMTAAITALAEWLERYDKAYGGKEVRRVMSLADCELPGAARLDLDALAMWTADVVQAAEAV